MHFYEYSREAEKNVTKNSYVLNTNKISNNLKN